MSWSRFVFTKLRFLCADAVKSFRSRASKIADHGHNTQGALSDGADFMRGLDESERQLFRSAHEGPRSVKAWSQNLKKA